MLEVLGNKRGLRTGYANQLDGEVDMLQEEERELWSEDGRKRLLTWGCTFVL